MDANKVLSGPFDSIIVLKREDLLEFANTYARILHEKQPGPSSGTNSEQPISQPDAIKFLGKSRQTLVDWRKKGIIQAYRIGGRVYYKPSELTSAMQKL